MLRAPGRAKGQALWTPFSAPNALAASEQPSRIMRGTIRAVMPPDSAPLRARPPIPVALDPFHPQGIGAPSLGNPVDFSLNLEPTGSMNLATTLRDLNNNIAPANSKQAYGAVFDTTSPSDKPIALIVGINYGQTKTAGQPNDEGDAVGYFQHIQRLAKVKNLEQTEYSVVLWNFYPYLTDSEWTAEVKNTKEEALRIFDNGYKDPIATFVSVVEKLDPKMIVFHGVRSAVPILARIALRSVHRDGYLVPNLSRGRWQSCIEKIS